MPRPGPKRSKSPRQPSGIGQLLVLVEDLGTEIRRVAEGHSTLQQQMDQLRQDLTVRIDSLENQMNLNFRDVFQRLDRVEQELAQVKQAVFETSKRVEIHEKAHAT